ncbi:uncharacterized protein LOC115889983 isoform X3 [Sitophilus oryzae]|uniref:Gustatory receptor n=1 Tax=Sitophilus oryzae TaxID=7048 RepID=A0A6J2YPI4_SITOR|nr:uncharacterized protein LOC115889983 isoform X3 [Sitophilus oryzae]
MHAFYYYFRPLAVLGKIFGAFPIENVLSCDPHKLRYKKLSFTFVYSLCLQYGLLVLIQSLSGFQFQADTMPLKLLKYLVIFMVVRSLSSFTFSLFTHAHRMPRLIQLLDAFDVKKKDLLALGNEWCLSTNVAVRIICPMLFFVFFASTYAYASKNLIKQIYPASQSQKPFLFSAADYFGVLCSWHVLPSLYFIIFSSIISKNYKHINETLIEKKCTGNYYKIDAIQKIDGTMEDTIGQMRVLHNMLSEATVQLNKCYGSFMAIEKIFMCSAVVINVSLYVSENHHFVELITVTTLNLAVFVSTLLVASKLKKRGAKVARLFQGIPLSTLSEKSRNEVQLWLLQLSVHPVHVNAAGYFILDKTQTFEVLSSIATYLIVAVQLLEDQKTTV